MENCYVIASQTDDAPGEMLKCLSKDNGKIDGYTIAKAAENGHIDIVKFLVENGGKIEDYAVSIAVKNGHIDIGTYRYCKIFNGEWRKG